MTAARIAHLIASRNKLTNRRDEWVDWKAVNRIDAQLAQVPAGQNNEVDRLLGRLCAVLPVRAALQAACAEVGVTARWYPADVAMAEQYRMMSDGQPDGIVEHYDSSTEGHW